MWLIKTIIYGSEVSRQWPVSRELHPKPFTFGRIIRMNAPHPTPMSIFSGLILHRELLWKLVKRGFIERYNGSITGFVRSLFNPLIRLTLYSVFSVAFKSLIEVQA